MNIERIPTGAFEENCYIIWGETRQALIIDPGYDAHYLIEYLEMKQLTVVAYLCTHAHTDHINALAEMHQEHPAPVYMHADDQSWGFGEQNQLAPYYGPPKQPDTDLIEVNDGDKLSLGGLDIEVITTPGHTVGGVCYYFPKTGNIFTGDTLFRGSVGRTDLPGGDAKVLKESLKRLCKLPDETMVYAGHGARSSIGEEKVSNFFLQ